MTKVGALPICINLMNWNSPVTIKLLPKWFYMHCVQGQNYLFLMACNNLFTSEKLMSGYWNRVLFKCSAQLFSENLVLMYEPACLLVGACLLGRSEYSSCKSLLTVMLNIFCLATDIPIRPLYLEIDKRTYFHKYVQNIIAKT